MMKRALIVAAALGCIVSQSVFAAPAAPVTFELTQPDGTTFEARQKGDEYANWVETLEGYTIVESGGSWYYAVEDGLGGLEATPNLVGSLSSADLGALPKHASPAPHPRAYEPTAPRRIEKSLGRTISHTQNVVLILVDYTGTSFTYSDASFESLMFTTVADFFSENTYGGFTITPANESYGTSNDGVIHISRGIAHPNLGGGDWRSEARTIASEINTYIDFSAYDSDLNGTLEADELSLVMILAGYEASYNSTTPNAWGHKWNFSTLPADGVDLSPYTIFGERHGDHQATIGIMAHELGHLMLGLPDLYDSNGGSEGIGEWGLMGSGSWNQVGANPGDSPAHLSAWSKVELGMTDADDVDSSATSVSIASAHGTEVAKRVWIDAYKAPTGEFILLENRQQSGYDAGLPSNGLLIWHIDGSQTGNSNESRKLVDVEEADGNNDLDNETNRGDSGDPYPGTSSNTTFNGASNPNSNDNDGGSTGIAVTNISSSAATMTVDITPRTGGVGDNVYYYESVSSIWGFTNSVAWTGLRVTNDTTKDTLDGVDVYLQSGSSSVDIYYYTSISGGTPSTLIHSETGFTGSAGWNRFLLATPQSFPAGVDRGIVLKITDSGAGGFPAVSESSSDTSSGRSYLDSDGANTFAALSSDVCQVVLLSGETIDTTNIYVNTTPGSPETGTQANPFDTLAEGQSALDAGGTLHIESGYYNEVVTLNKQMSVANENGTVVVGTAAP